MDKKQNFQVSHSTELPDLPKVLLSPNPLRWITLFGPVRGQSWRVDLFYARCCIIWLQHSISFCIHFTFKMDFSFWYFEAYSVDGHPSVSPYDGLAGTTWLVTNDVAYYDLPDAAYLDEFS